jgi:prolyl oligopeptidase
VAEDLIARDITRPRHLGIWGGSQGGVLVGAVFTMRPELFNAVVCDFPVLDLKWTRDADDSTGARKDPPMWEYLRTFSPYHNVARGRRYPRVLFLTGTEDRTVPPGHARKMAARMLAYGHPVYFYEHPEASHGSTYAVHHEQTAYLEALMFTYLWAQLR